MISRNEFMISRNYSSISGYHLIILQEALEEGTAAHFQQAVPQISANDENVNPRIFGFSVITCILQDISRLSRFDFSFNQKAFPAQLQN